VGVRTLLLEIEVARFVSKRQPRRHVSIGAGGVNIQSVEIQGHRFARKIYHGDPHGGAFPARPGDAPRGIPEQRCRAARGMLEREKRVEVDGLSAFLIGARHLVDRKYFE
jgi:hypothetical protein